MSEATGQSTGRQRGVVFASYAIACGMVVCFGSVFVLFLHWLFRDWDVRGIVIICTLVVLEAFFSFWLVQRLPTAQKQMIFFRGTELVILLVVLKLFTDLRNGPESFWISLNLWPVQFPLNILTGQYFLTILPVLACWWAGCLFAADLSLLGIEDVLITDERFKTTPFHSVILQRYLSLGVFAVILAAIPAQNIFQTSMPPAFNAIPAVITYFILGIILLSLTRYVDLETKWSEARLAIPVQLPRRWFAYTALILSILVLLIIWIPTNYGMGLIDTLKAIYRILYQLSELLYELFLLVISLIASLFTRNRPDLQNAVIPPATPQPLNISPSRASSFSWELVKSIFLWGSLILLVIVAIRQYIAYNRDLSDELRGFRPIRWLLIFWNRFKASFNKANKSLGIFIQSRLKRIRHKGQETTSPGEWNFINLRRLPPRQKVIFYYLALVRRAREVGLPRQDGQTPYEYARSLTTRLNEEKEDLEILTNSFVEARYSRHEIPAKAARKAETIWETIRHVLQKIRKSRQ